MKYILLFLVLSFKSLLAASETLTSAFHGYGISNNTQTSDHVFEIIPPTVAPGTKRVVVKFAYSPNVYDSIFLYMYYLNNNNEMHVGTLAHPASNLYTITYDIPNPRPSVKFYIRTSTHSNFTQNNFTISWEYYSDDSDEPNSAPVEAHTVLNKETLYPNFILLDNDYYFFNSLAKEKVSFEITKRGTEITPAVLQIDILDSDDNVLETLDGTSQDQNVSFQSDRVYDVGNHKFRVYVKNNLFGQRYDQNFYDVKMSTPKNAVRAWQYYE